jgi:hypothetical protein
LNEEETKISFALQMTGKKEEEDKIDQQNGLKIVCVRTDRSFNINIDFNCDHSPFSDKLEQ